MSPVAINGVDKQGVYIDGVQVKQALSADNETVNKGVYDATTLSAVDADLDDANIKVGVTIFGKTGTVVPGGIETIEKYADATLAASATYTPSDSGIFFIPYTNITAQYRGDVWYRAQAISEKLGQTAIGDGSNFRISNDGSSSQEYCLFRHYYSTGTYTRESSGSLAVGESYTPSSSGFFAEGLKDIYTAITCESLFTTAGWQETRDATDTATIMIGDGTNFRVHSINGTYYYVLMLAKMTT